MEGGVEKDSILVKFGDGLSGINEQELVYHLGWAEQNCVIPELFDMIL